MAKDNEVTKPNFPGFLASVLLLTGTGWLVYTKIMDLRAWREAPFIIGEKSPEEITREFTVSIPELWIPWQPGDTKEGVEQNLKPDISIEGTNWLIQFKPIRVNIDGIFTEYRPDPVKVPLVPSISTLQLAAKIVPVITPTTEPMGWTIKFPKFVILA